MADLQIQTPDTTHTYVARAWYRDTAMLFNIASFVFLLLQDQTFMAGLPDAWRHLFDKLIVAFNLWIRWQSSTRPVALVAGSTREVHSIPPKEIGGGSVSDSTRTKLLSVMLLLALTGAQSCASLGGARHVAAVSVVSVHGVLSLTQDTERALVCGGATAPAPPSCVPPDVHRTIAGYFVTAFDLDGQVARLVRATPAGSLTPGEVPGLLARISALLDAIFKALPTSPQKSQLIAQVAEGSR